DLSAGTRASRDAENANPGLLPDPRRRDHARARHQGGAPEGGRYRRPARHPPRVEQPVGCSMRSRDILARRDLLETRMLEIDKSTGAFARLVSPDAPLDRIYHGLSFGEGPLWNRRDGTFLWVDIVGDTIWRFKAGTGAEPLIRPSGKANGLTFDRQGRLCVAGWASRSVWRVEADGSVKTLASHHEGKKINSPNDIVVRSDGSIYFTDSPGALYNVGMAAE